MQGEGSLEKFHSAELKLGVKVSRLVYVVHLGGVNLIALMRCSIVSYQASGGGRPP